MIRQEEALAVQLLDGGEERLQGGRIIEIGRFVAKLAVDLRQRRATQAITTHAEIHEEQLGVALVQAQLRGQGPAYVGHRGKGTHHERQRSGDPFLLAAFVPDSTHRHRVLADGNGDAKGRGQLGTHGPHGLVEPRILAGIPGRGHPIGRQFDVADLRDGRTGDVGQRFAHGHARGGGRIQQRQRGALAHGHGFAGVAVVAGGGHRCVRHRHLPRTHHLIAAHQPGHRAVADGDEEGLVGHRGQSQHARDRLVQIEVGGGEGCSCCADSLGPTQHLGRLSEQEGERHVDGLVAEVGIGHHQPAVGCRLAEDSEGATLATAKVGETAKFFGRDRQHVAFLRLVAPDLLGRHARLVVGDLAQLEYGAAAAIVHQLGQRVGQTARAHVVDRVDRVGFAQRPAAIDDLLAAALHLGVVALNRREVEVFLGSARGHG